MAENGKYYWLKLKRDFFKRHDIRIIEEMPNGKDYILFYLKLLLESIDHEGSLRFSDTIPYNEQMLSVVTNTNIDIVRSAMKLFIELNMMSICDDKTIYMTEVDKLIGSETKWAEKKRIQRTKGDIVPQLSSNCPIEIDIDKEINKEIHIDIEKKEIHKEKKPNAKAFVPPTYEEVLDYAKEKGREDIALEFFEYFNVGNWIDSKGNKVKNWKQKFITWCSRNEKKKGATNEVNSGDNGRSDKQKYGIYI